MAAISVSAEAPIAAPAERVYRILADYRTHHPQILPPQISNLVVDEGGVGAGTLFRFQTTIGGRTQRFRQRVDEPQPGVILQEVDLERDYVTTFTVTPDGTGCRVRIDSTWRSDGVRGAIERLLAPRLLRPVYEEELRRLDRYAADHPDS